MIFSGRNEDPFAPPDCLSSAANPRAGIYNPAGAGREAVFTSRAANR